MIKFPVFFILATVVFFPITEMKSQQLYFPPVTGTAWETASPESFGWRTEKIDTLMNFLEANHTKAFIVLINGRIILEHYFDSFTDRHEWSLGSIGV
jgi:hypothetical protein